MYPQSMFLSQNEKNIIIFHLKINIFAAVKYCCILHGCVCVVVLYRALPVIETRSLSVSGPEIIKKSSSCSVSLSMK